MFDWVIAPQSATTLYIYRVGRSCPGWSWSPNKSRTKIQLQLGLQSPDPVKPPGPHGLTARVTWRSSRSHICLIRTPNSTFYIWISIYSTRPIQWGSPNYLLRTFSRRSNRGTWWSNKVSADLPILGVNTSLLIANLSHVELHILFSNVAH
jgi:hypothetical protein